MMIGDNPLEIEFCNRLYLRKKRDGQLGIQGAFLVKRRAFMENVKYRIVLPAAPNDSDEFDYYSIGGIYFKVTK